MASDHIARVMNVAFFFSYSDMPGFSFWAFAFGVFSLKGLPSDASVLELCRRFSAPFARCWNLTLFGFAMIGTYRDYSVVRVLLHKAAGEVLDQEIAVLARESFEFAGKLGFEPSRAGEGDIEDLRRQRRSHTV